MTYTIQLFALLRERTGAATWSLESDRNLSAGDILTAFYDAHPSLSGLRHTTRMAVNAQFVVDDLEITPDSEIALIPPVSGG